MKMASASSQLPGPTRHTLHDVWSPQFRNHRNVDVYLPASYAAGGTHPVVYMQDGQNLSDPSIAFAGTWELESALLTLGAGGIQPIVVGVHNTNQRLAEYSPFPDAERGGGLGDRYLSFVIRTLKPRIDRLFHTTRSASQTAILGSSMGGLISLYGWLRHPEVFSRAGVISPSLWYGRERLFDFIESVPLPRGRLYLDVGTAEGDSTLRDVRALWALLQDKVVPGDTQLEYREAEGGHHDEAAWGRRLGGALEFLLGDCSATGAIKA